MRKLLVFGIIVISILCFGANAFADDITANVLVAENGNTIEISGSVPTGGKQYTVGISVVADTETLNVDTIKFNAVGVRLLLTDTNGAFNTKFEIGGKGETGWYSLTVGCGAAETTYTEKFFVATEKQKSDFLNEINSAEAADIEAILKKYSQDTLPILKINVEQFEKDRELIIQYIIDEREKALFASVGEFQEVYDSYVVLLNINNIIKAEEFESILDNYRDVFSVDYSNEYLPIATNINAMLLDKKNSLIDGKFNSLSHFDEIYKESAVLCAINVSGPEEIGNIIKKNNDIFGITLDSIKNFDIIDICKALYMCDFKDASEVKATFNSRIKDLESQMNSKNQSSKGSSSGGGGSSDMRSTGIVSLPSVNREPVVEKPVIEDIKFNDIRNHWAEEYINCLYDKRIVSGNEDKCFLPDNSINRAEFIKMLILSVNRLDNKAVNPFPDVNDNEWYAHYIASAYQEGFVFGDENGYFNPNSLITREDVCAIIFRAMEKCDLIKSKKNTVIKFDDSEDISEYARTAVSKLVSVGIVDGRGENSFAPKQVCTRAECAKLIYTLLSVGGIL